MGDGDRKGCAAVLRALPGDGRRGILRLGALTLRCALGRGGIGAFKREGDGATPLARLAVIGGYVRRDGRPAPWRAGLALRPIGARLGWCDAPADRNYNRPVRLPYPASAETMRRGDGLYDVCLVLDWNLRPRRRGAGSAIFLHIARDGLAPTEGCIALSRRDMERLLPHVVRGTAIEVRR